MVQRYKYSLGVFPYKQDSKTAVVTVWNEEVELKVKSLTQDEVDQQHGVSSQIYSQGITAHFSQIKVHILRDFVHPAWEGFQWCWYTKSGIFCDKFTTVQQVFDVQVKC